MALLKHNQLRRLLSSSIIRLMSEGKVVTLEIDAADVIDNFTSDLMQKKSSKWSSLNIRKQLRCSYNLVRPIAINTDLKMSAEELDRLIITMVDDENVKELEYIMESCCRDKRCPSLAVLMSVLDVYSRNGNVGFIEKAQVLLKESNEALYVNNGELKHYLAEALWIKGDVTKALAIFEALYRDNVYLRRRVRMMLRSLILDVTTRSEAVLYSIVNFGERLKKEFCDYFPLACVWQACFTSEWFSDQTFALELLERNEGLCRAVTPNIPYVVIGALKSHQTEIIHRLLEILLKYEMRLQYTVVMIALFDYRFHQGDLRRCSEIIKWSVDNHVTLPANLHERFVMLLLKKPVGFTSSVNIAPTKNSLQFKF